MEKPEYKKRWYLVTVLIGFFCIYCFAVGFIETIDYAINFLINIINIIK